ncbi:MAG TPA: glutamine synthetase III [Candidatus Avilachnospira avistercoris]|nr:glutamine synthetase III [Candidatus Avilachnospira avistercoris]
MSSNIPEIFGSMVFSDREMKKSLPSHVYSELQQTRKEGKALNQDIADAVATAMKNWAVEKGATHFTHWFQPMTGFTAEKHDSFINPEEGGRVILEFSGKELLKGEPDASSFPSGGLRATFEARGYTAWDPTSDAFIKDNTLCIPTAFCSYNGAILDKKTPLLRSMDALSLQGCRIMSLLGKDVKRVSVSLGCEQEYFLIDKADYVKRPDLKLCGRTLFGAPSPKDQQLGDHYFGTIRPRVKAFMEELDEELWKLGICSKTEHNEVAPCQHEMAPIYTVCNLAADQNELTMDIMKKVADRHGFACLLHEKPFAGINGSGKHNNWSLCTDRGENLLKPGKSPADNRQFLLVLAAVVKAVDDYADLLRVSVASAGNDCRLGGHEAPPAIVSMYIGDTLMRVVESIIKGETYQDTDYGKLDTKTLALPAIPKDNSDRNRTSPFAFTGEKFEFRMPGSSMNVSCMNIMLNTAVAESFRQFADELENVPPEELPQEIDSIVKREFTAHQRIIFNGNGYGEEWVKEAEERGLLNLKNTPETMKHFVNEKNLALFKKHGIYNFSEMQARHDITLDEYIKVEQIEASTMIYMSDKLIFPAALKYISDVSEGIGSIKALGLSTDKELPLLNEMASKLMRLKDKTAELESLLKELPEDIVEAADFIADKLIPVMGEIREAADCLERKVAKNYWPYPDYADILFY